MVLEKDVLILQHKKEGNRNKANTSIPFYDDGNAHTNLVLKKGRKWRRLQAAYGSPVTKKRWRVLINPYNCIKKGSPITQFKLMRSTFSGDPEDRVEETEFDFDGIVVLDGNLKEVNRLIELNPWLSKLPVLQLVTETNVDTKVKWKHFFSSAGSIAVIMELISGTSGLAETLFAPVRTALADVYDYDVIPGNWKRRKRIRTKAEWAALDQDTKTQLLNRNAKKKSRKLAQKKKVKIKKQAHKKKYNKK